MKLVIEIDDEHYATITNKVKAIRDEVSRNGYANNDVVPIGWVSIADGIPLLKGYGRLIDADALEYTCNADECGMLTGCNHCQYHIVTEHEIDNAPTIIEADKSVLEKIAETQNSLKSTCKAWDEAIEKDGYVN